MFVLSERVKRKMRKIWRWNYIYNLIDIVLDLGCVSVS